MSTLTGNIWFSNKWHHRFISILSDLKPPQLYLYRELLSVTVGINILYKSSTCSSSKSTAYELSTPTMERYTDSIAEIIYLFLLPSPAEDVYSHRQKQRKL